MRIDQTHRKWFAASLVIFGAATAVYVPYAAQSPGPRGGSVLGLTFGSLGSAFMVFAGLLAARKKVPIWRVGRAQAWMRGHLWLGLLSLPIILFHAGFHFGGMLTSVLMILLIIVIASGIFGAALQHFLPHVMTVEVPGETIFEQIDHVRDQLIEEADRLAGTALGLTESREREEEGRGGTSVAVKAELAVDESVAPLRNFYVLEIEPFLTSRGKGHLLLSDNERARGAFESLRTLLPAELHPMTRRLEAICEEERELQREARIHHWLHGWLMMHIPLSFALLLLGCVHAITALRY